MSRFNNYGKSAWGVNHPDMFHNGASRRPTFNIRRNEIFQRQDIDDGDLEGRPTGESHREDPVTEKLDRLLDKMEKFDQWKDATDRRLQSLNPVVSRGTEPPLGVNDADEEEYVDFRRGKSGDTGFRARNPNLGYRELAPEERVQRAEKVNNGSEWDPPTTRYGRTCWDPPQRYYPAAAGFDRNQVSNKPPRFNGSEATNWIARVQYYFNHVMMPEAQRLHYAVMLFDPPASEWVFNYCANNEFVTWPEFLEDVRHRFDRQSFKDYFGLIAKITQKGTVLEYHDTFEKYLNWVQGVPEVKLFTLFVAGLKPEMQERLTLHRPTSLAAAMALSLEIADTHSERANPQSTSTFQRRQWTGRDNRTSAGPTGSQPPSGTVAGAKPAPGQQQQPKEQPRRSMIRVSQAERAERSRLRLCWHCPEKWVAGHVCKQRLLCYADQDDVLEVDASDKEIVEELEPKEVAYVHALHEGRRSRPLRVVGAIQGRDVSVLIDTGSDRDFLHPDIVKSLHLPLSPIRPFRVIVGNGEALLCSHVSRRTELEMQGSTFLVDLHILPVHGPDVILGMDWLESLGKVAADFAGKTLEFKHGDRTVVLKGKLPPPRRANPQFLSSLSSSGDDVECFEILLLQPEQPDSEPESRDEFPAGLPPGVLSVLEQFRGVFGTPVGMPPFRPFDHRVHLLPGTRPVNVHPYRYPYFQKNEIERQVKDMLEQGIIQRSNSPFSSPVLLIRKKDDTFRFCIDYRALNNATVPDHFPIPTAVNFLMNWAAMNSIFHPMLRKFVIVFFDDILVYSPSLEVYGEHLSAVLRVLQDHSFFVKLSKFSFCSSTVEYLGHLIGDGSLKADPNKISVMTAWPKPKNVKQLRRFLGLTGYYRRFITGYAVITSPLTDLLKKDAFVWTPAADSSFLDLKGAMTTAPVLRLPDFEKTFCVETDASNTGICAVLLQDNHPIAFFSRKLGPRHRVASTYHKELYAIVEAVQKWRQYLLGREFIIRSDQKSLKELLQQIVQTLDQQLYVRKLMGYKFIIEYKKGSTNRAANALSRREDTDQTDPQEGAASDAEEGSDTGQSGALLAAASHPIPHLLDLLRRETCSSPEMREITTDIKERRAPPHLTLVDGLVYYNRHIFVGSRSSARTPILTEYHSSQSAGHPGFERTLRRMAADFY
ncbi:uncharacterized protein LOC121781486 [Salvia splendens]|uniref:uncharacterized protein LOC121781486 n=1 Tax=Salvia splendens TaxID=180675 RepID=UPI001C258115|nr:uncharacterized protein LOC121781486 [Salvia splendens]